MALYQQGVQRIEVVVRKEETASAGDGDTADKINADSGEQATSGETDTTTMGANAKTRFARVNLSHAVGVMKEIANAVINYKVHETSLANGDEALGQSIDRQLEIAQDITGSASHIIMGGLYGSAGGPVGMALGVAFASVSQAVSLTSKYSNRQLEYNYKQFRLDNGTNYKRARASVSLTTGRLR